MNDYISRRKIIAEYDRVHVGAAGGARKLMVEAPAEDVVPRAEYERVKAKLDSLIKNYAGCMKYYAREIFAEINNIKKEYASGDIDGNELYIRLYMLEKKYMEDGHEIGLD